MPDETCDIDGCDEPAHLTGRYAPNVCLSHAEAWTTTQEHYVINGDGEV